MISGLKSLFQRRVSGSTVAPATPNAAPVPAGLVAMTPAEAAEHARKLDERKAAFHAKQAQQPTPRSTKTETTKVEAPKVEASTELPKAAPKVELPQAPKASVKAPETPKATLATSDAVETPRQAPASVLGNPRATVADAKSSEQPTYRSTIEFGTGRTFTRGTVHELWEDFGITKHHAQLIDKLESFCSPFDTRRQCSRDVRRVLVCTWGDAEALRNKLTTSPGHKPLSGSSRPQWTDGLSVLGLGHSLDETFVVNSITLQAKQLRPEVILIWDRPEMLETFSNDVRANALLGQLAAKTGAVVLLYRSVKDC